MTRGRNDVPRVGRRKNELKLLALSYLLTNKDVSAKTMSEDLNLKFDNARMILFRLHRYTLAKRKPKKAVSLNGRPPYLYSITERGIEKFNYLTSF